MSSRYGDAWIRKWIVESADEQHVVVPESWIGLHESGIAVVHQNIAIMYAQFPAPLHDQTIHISTGTVDLLAQRFDGNDLQVCRSVPDEEVCVDVRRAEVPLNATPRVENVQAPEILIEIIPGLVGCSHPHRDFPPCGVINLTHVSPSLVPIGTPNSIQGRMEWGQKSLARVVAISRTNSRRKRSTSASGIR